MFLLLAAVVVAAEPLMDLVAAQAEAVRLLHLEQLAQQIREMLVVLVVLLLLLVVVAAVPVELRAQLITGMLSVALVVMVLPQILLVALCITAQVVVAVQVHGVEVVAKVAVEQGLPVMQLAETTWVVMVQATEVVAVVPPQFLKEALDLQVLWCCLHT